MQAAIKAFSALPMQALVGKSYQSTHWPDNFQLGRVHALVVIEE